MAQLKTPSWLRPLAPVFPVSALRFAEQSHKIKVPYNSRVSAVRFRNASFHSKARGLRGSGKFIDPICANMDMDEEVIWIVFLKPRIGSARCVDIRDKAIALLSTRTPKAQRKTTWDLFENEGSKVIIRPPSCEAVYSELTSSSTGRRAAFC